MDQNQLFTTMFKDDGEGQKLMLVPGADELMTQFEQKFTAIVYTMFQVGLKVNIVFIYNEGDSIYRLVFQEKEIRDHEIDVFWICVNEAKDENTRRAAAIVDEFKDYRTQLFVSRFIDLYKKKRNFSY